MAFFTSKKIKIIGLAAVGVLLFLGVFYLFSKGAKEEKTFAGSESVLETKSKTSPVQRLISEPDIVSSNLSVTSQPDKITVEMIKVISDNPLTLDYGTRQTLTTPFLLNNLAT